MIRWVHGLVCYDRVILKHIKTYSAIDGLSNIDARECFVRNFLQRGEIADNVPSSHVGHGKKSVTLI
jgi:hypothetical protein